MGQQVLIPHSECIQTAATQLFSMSQSYRPGRMQHDQHTIRNSAGPRPPSAGPQKLAPVRPFGAAPKGPTQPHSSNGDAARMVCILFLGIGTLTGALPKSSDHLQCPRRSSPVFAAAAVHLMPSMFSGSFSVCRSCTPEQLWCASHCCPLLRPDQHTARLQYTDSPERAAPPWQCTCCLAVQEAASHPPPSAPGQKPPGLNRLPPGRAAGEAPSPCSSPDNRQWGLGAAKESCSTAKSCLQDVLCG